MPTAHPYRLRRRAAALCLGAALCALTACSPAKDPVRAGTIELKGAGSTMLGVLYKDWFAGYHSSHPGTVVSYEPVGSREGIRRFVAKDASEAERVDFAASDAGLPADQAAAVERGAVVAPIAADSVALVYNLPNFDGDLRLSREAYAGIFLGRIQNWKDRAIARANPGKKLPDLPITRVVRQDGSGTTFAFTNHLSSISEDWKNSYGPKMLVNWPGEVQRARGSEGVAGRVRDAVGSIGYVGLAYAKQSNLREALLENKEGSYIGPSEAAAEAAFRSLSDIPADLMIFVPDPAGRESYPIVTLSWVILYARYDDAQKAQALRSLFHWCLTDGQRITNDLGYMPLPAPIAERTLAAIDGVNGRT